MSTSFKDTVIASLDTMRLGELAAGERFKALAYKKAIDNIRRMDKPLNTIDDVKDIDGIGAKIHAKIVEILATGSLRAAERMTERTDVGGMETLLKVHGIGPVKARSLLEAGITTIDSLRKAAAVDKKLLTAAQTLGLKYYEDGLARIPRSEMTQHEHSLMSTLPKMMSGTVVGSYRRGAADSGDIDLLITYKESYGEDNAIKSLYKIIEMYSAAGYIIDTLVSGPKKWMGYVRLSEDTPVRRLDIMLTPPTEYAYAILYFTGSDKFNIGFRKHCQTIGYTLNEHNLKPTQAGVRPIPSMANEEDIFAFAQLRYVKPTERVDGNQIVCL